MEGGVQGSFIVWAQLLAVGTQTCSLKAGGRLQGLEPWQSASANPKPGHATPWHRHPEPVGGQDAGGTACTHPSLPVSSEMWRVKVGGWDILQGRGVLVALHSLQYVPCYGEQTGVSRHHATAPRFPQLPVGCRPLGWGARANRDCGAKPVSKPVRSTRSARPQASGLGTAEGQEGRAAGSGAGSAEQVPPHGAPAPAPVCARGARPPPGLCASDRHPRSRGGEDSGPMGLELALRARAAFSPRAEQYLSPPASALPGPERGSAGAPPLASRCPSPAGAPAPSPSSCPSSPSTTPSLGSPPRAD